MTALGVGRKLGGPWEQKKPRLRFGERDAHGKTTTEILHVVQNDGPWGGEETRWALGAKRAAATVRGARRPRKGNYRDSALDNTESRMTDVGCARARMTAFGVGEETRWALGARRPRKGNYRDSALDNTESRMTDVGCARARMTAFGVGEETRWALGAKRVAAAVRGAGRPLHTLRTCVCPLAIVSQGNREWSRRFAIAVSINRPDSRRGNLDEMPVWISEIEAVTTELPR